MAVSVAIVGSHGFGAKRGGWDQLVNCLCRYKSESVVYTVFNPKENTSQSSIEGVKIQRLPISKNSGFLSMLSDALALIFASKYDTVLLLGPKVVPLALILKLFTRVRLVINVGGIEWLRPQFGLVTKLYLRLCFFLSVRYSNAVILDNQSYFDFVNIKFHDHCQYIPYGADISHQLNVDQLGEEFPFLKKNFFLSVSRSIRDNMIRELCEAFRSPECEHLRLVLISNFSKSEYGRDVFNSYKDDENIILIDGLYNKDKLDCIRRNTMAYIHTHTLCGTAPSLVEAMASGVPVISNDLLQNRYTTVNDAVYFSDFEDLVRVVNHDFSEGVISAEVNARYEWPEIVKSYEDMMV